ncbi:MAG: cyclase family protein [Sphingomonadaceae bacterium]|nr:cyclase family protein [Sphingomonadaceae bacterium]
MTVLAELAQLLAAGAVRVVDLTQPLSPDTPALVLPPEFGQCAGFTRREVSRYDERGSAWYWAEIAMNEHTGTHFDAPVHWVTGRELPDNTTATIPPGRLVGPAAVIDVSAECAADPDFLLKPGHIEAWEATHGRVPADCWLLLRTDWSKRHGDAYTNRDDTGAHTPGPSAAAVQVMLDRGVRGFGVETIGTDAGQAHGFDPPYPAHTLLHGAGRYGLQCLTNLDQLPPTGAIVIAPPLKIVDGSGSPLRVLALVES